jgi:hypothetical protein
MINNKTILHYGGASSKEEASKKVFDPDFSCNSSEKSNKKPSLDDLLEYETSPRKNFTNSKTTKIDLILEERRKRDAKPKTDKKQRKTIKKSRKSNRKR